MPDEAVFTVHLEASAEVTPGPGRLQDDTPDTDEAPEAEE